MSSSSPNGRPNRRLPRPKPRSRRSSRSTRHNRQRPIAPEILIRRLRQEDRRDPGRRRAVAALLPFGFLVAVAGRIGLPRFVGGGHVVAFAAQFFEPLADHFKIICSAWPVHRSSLSLGSTSAAIPHYVAVSYTHLTLPTIYSV